MQYNSTDIESFNYNTKSSNSKHHYNLYIRYVRLSKMLKCNCTWVWTLKIRL